MAREERVGAHNVILDDDRVRAAADSWQLDLFGGEVAEGTEAVPLD